MMNLIARLPEMRDHLPLHVLRRREAVRQHARLQANFAQMLGYDDPSFHELMRTS